MSYSSASKYVSKLKRLHQTVLRLSPGQTKLRLHTAAFFERPVNDVEVEIRVYDVTGGTRVGKVSYEVFLADKRDRFLFHWAELDRDEVPPNRKYCLAVVSRRRVLASTTFTLVSETSKASPQVLDFSN